MYLATAMVAMYIAIAYYHHFVHTIIMYVFSLCTKSINKKRGIGTGQFGQAMVHNDCVNKMMIVSVLGV